MPITASAKKALRQNRRRRVRNLGRKQALKSTIKAFKRAPNAEALTLVYQRLDKAAKVNLITRNTASRLKSRLSRLLRK